MGMVEDCGARNSGIKFITYIVKPVSHYLPWWWSHQKKSQKSHAYNGTKLNTYFAQWYAFCLANKKI